MFAEATDHVEPWKKALEGWNVMQSKQVLEWQAQARREGIAAMIRETRDIALLKTWLKVARHARDLDQFLQETSLG